LRIKDISPYLESGFLIKIYSSADIGYEKPNVKIYEKVLLGLSDVDSITMIGDNYNADIQGVKKAGIDAILVRKSNDYNYTKYFTTLKLLSEIMI
jgi:putative hydrolase of the HAD superfamily